MSEPKNIEVQKIRFGDPDALHEFMKQDKDGSLVLQNSFVAPPRTSLSELKSGSKYLIVSTINFEFGCEVWTSGPSHQIRLVNPPRCNSMEK